MHSSISETLSGQAWSPVIGCTPTSTGCLNCYGATTILRSQESTQTVDPKHIGTVRQQPSGRATYTGLVRADRKALNLPMQWTLPRLIIVNPLSDLFHERISAKFIRDVFRVMQDCPQHTFTILTKRPERALTLSAQLSWARNISLGVTVENQSAAHRAATLAQIPATKRFIQAEPLIGPITDLPLAGISWVQAGPEFGSDARTMDSAWIKLLRTQCQANEVHFTTKLPHVEGVLEPKTSPAIKHQAA